MQPHEHLLIFGASARAAAFSALRAGLRPWCADLFADADLQAVCPVVALPPADYPAGFAQLAREGPPGPWIYAGGLENRPELVRAIARRRRLWGNDERAIRRARSAPLVAAILRVAGLAGPAVHTDLLRVPSAGRWLVKPRTGAGGSGIRLLTDAPAPGQERTPSYLQEFIPGEACAAVYAGDGRGALLLGASRQLVGESWLHARPFHYCGSIGPLEPAPGLRQSFERIGDALARGCGLRGLFGVDCILREGVPWPVEVNPRYTASVEVLEHALGVPALALHRRAFDPDAADVPAPAPAPFVGKAILFARAPLVFPRDGPWLAALRPSTGVERLPAFADIPPIGQVIKAGRPVLTFFARGGSPAECATALRQIASDLDRRLFA